MPPFVQFVEIFSQGVSVENVYDFVEISFFSKNTFDRCLLQKNETKQHITEVKLLLTAVFTVKMHFKNHNYSAFGFTNRGNGIVERLNTFE